MLKDFLTLRWYILLGLPLGVWVIAMFARYNSPLFLFLSGWILIWFILARGIFALDAHTRSEAIINSLPLSKKEIVAGRHMTSMAFLAFGFLVMLLLNAIVGLTGYFPGPATPFISVLSLGLPISAVLTSVLFPLLFKLDFTKARWITFVIVLSVFFIFMEMARSGKEMHMPGWIFGFLEMPALLRLSAAVLAFAVLTWLSILLCTRIYRAREF